MSVIHLKEVPSAWKYQYYNNEQVEDVQEVLPTVECWLERVSSTKHADLQDLSIGPSASLQYDSVGSGHWTMDKPVSVLKFRIQTEFGKRLSSMIESSDQNVCPV